MNDLKHYLALAAILSLGFGLFWIFNYNRDLQIVVTLGMAAAYLAWGLGYHHRRRELTRSLAGEYLAVAAVSCLLVIFLLLRS